MLSASITSNSSVCVCMCENKGRTCGGWEMRVRRGDRANLREEGGRCSHYLDADPACSSFRFTGGSWSSSRLFSGCMLWPSERRKHSAVVQPCSNGWICVNPGPAVGILPFLAFHRPLSTPDGTSNLVSICHANATQ